MFCHVAIWHIVDSCPHLFVESFFNHFQSFLFRKRATLFDSIIWIGGTIIYIFLAAFSPEVVGEGLSKMFVTGLEILERFHTWTNLQLNLISQRAVVFFLYSFKFFHLFLDIFSTTICQYRHPLELKFSHLPLFVYIQYFLKELHSFRGLLLGHFVEDFVINNV